MYETSAQNVFNRICPPHNLPIPGYALPHIHDGHWVAGGWENG